MSVSPRRELIGVFGSLGLWVFGSLGSEVNRDVEDRASLLSCQKDSRLKTD